jgi:hypothetical protein
VEPVVASTNRKGCSVSGKPVSDDELIRVQSLDILLRNDADVRPRRINLAVLVPNDDKYG